MEEVGWRNNYGNHEGHNSCFVAKYTTSQSSKSTKVTKRELGTGVLGFGPADRCPAAYCLLPAPLSSMTHKFPFPSLAAAGAEVYSIPSSNPGVMPYAAGKDGKTTCPI